MVNKIGLTLLMAVGFCCAQTEDGFSPASTNVWGAAYPQIDNNGKAEFRVKAPYANKLQVNFWGAAKLDMVKQPDGFWTATSGALVPGFHYYTLLIDGAEVSDPGSHTFLEAARTRAGSKFRNRELRITYRRTCHTARFGRTRTIRRSLEAGGTL